MYPCVNIHTHYLPKNQEISIFNNRFLSDTELYSDTYFSVGIHPWDIELVDEHSMRALEKVITHENCLAIGECGLDKLKQPDIERQKTVFGLQIQLAVQYKKPMIIHCVKAFEELIALCSPYQGKIPFVIHGFNKSEQLALQLIRKGFYVSLDHAIFNKLSFNFKNLPIENLFLETDDTLSIFVEQIYDKASMHFNMQIDNLKEKMYTNFKTVFL